MEKQRKFKKLHRSHIAVYLLLCFFSAVVLVPFLYLILTSFKTLEDVSGATSRFFPSSNALIENIKFVMSYPKFHFFRAFGNTFFVFLMKTVGVLVTCSLAGYGFSRFPGKLNSFVFMMFVAVLFLPGELLGIPFYEAMITLRLRYNEAYLPLWIGAWAGIDISTIFLFKQFFTSTPSALVDAAKVDGCGEFRAFFRIVLPLAKPVIITTVILYFVGTYNDVYSPTLYIRANDFDRKLISQTIGIFEGMFDGGSKDFLVPWNYVSVATLISILPVVLLFGFAQRYFVESLVGSGIKG